MTDKEYFDRVEVLLTSMLKGLLKKKGQGKLKGNNAIAISEITRLIEKHKEISASKGNNE